MVLTEQEIEWLEINREKDIPVNVMIQAYRELAEENKRLKELLEWSARIIDSGMGAGILRYDPIQFFIDYHTLLKEKE